MYLAWHLFILRNHFAIALFHDSPSLCGRAEAFWSEHKTVVVQQWDALGSSKTTDRLGVDAPGCDGLVWACSSGASVAKRGRFRGRQAAGRPRAIVSLARGAKVNVE